MKFSLYPTTDLGYNSQKGFYWATLSMYINKVEYNVMVQCTQYDDMDAKGFTIEFLDAKENSVVFAYDESIFSEIEIQAYELFNDIKEESGLTA